MAETRPQSSLPSDWKLNLGLAAVFAVGGAMDLLEGDGLNGPFLLLLAAGIGAAYLGSRRQSRGLVVVGWVLVGLGVIAGITDLAS